MIIRAIPFTVKCTPLQGMGGKLLHACRIHHVLENLCLYHHAGPFFWLFFRCNSYSCPNHAHFMRETLADFTSNKTC